MMRAGPLELALLHAALARADHHRFELDRRLARLIVSEYGEAMKRGSRRR